ncbi:MAG: hypothetical protein R6U41_03010 [Desulfosalsimonas sp.]|uniref:hypothetical protein n=1 Tax=Desulfosalsimonas sp. TaxID=3073848 RepID=UPI003970F7C2
MRKNFSPSNNPPWLARWMDANGVALWGAADLDGLTTPTDSNERTCPCHAAQPWKKVSAEPA